MYYLKIRFLLILIGNVQKPQLFSWQLNFVIPTFHLKKLEKLECPPIVKFLIFIASPFNKIFYGAKFYKTPVGPKNGVHVCCFPSVKQFTTFYFFFNIISKMFLKFTYNSGPIFSSVPCLQHRTGTDNFLCFLLQISTCDFNQNKFQQKRLMPFLQPYLFKQSSRLLACKLGSVIPEREYGYTKFGESRMDIQFSVFFRKKLVYGYGIRIIRIRGMVFFTTLGRPILKVRNFK